MFLIRKIVRGILNPESFINVNDLLVYLYREGYDDLAKKLEPLRSTEER